MCGATVFCEVVTFRFEDVRRSVDEAILTTSAKDQEKCPKDQKLSLARPAISNDVCHVQPTKQDFLQYTVVNILFVIGICPIDRVVLFKNILGISLEQTKKP